MTVDDAIEMLQECSEEGYGDSVARDSTGSPVDDIICRDDKCCIIFE